MCSEMKQEIRGIRCFASCRAGGGCCCTSVLLAAANRNWLVLSFNPFPWATNQQRNPPKEWSGGSFDIIVQDRIVVGRKSVGIWHQITLNTLADYGSLFLCIDVEVCAKGAEIIFISKTRHLIAKENKHKTSYGSFCFIYYSLAWIATPRVKCALCCYSCYMLVLQIGF